MHSWLYVSPCIGRLRFATLLYVNAGLVMVGLCCVGGVRLLVSCVLCCVIVGCVACLVVHVLFCGV